MKSSAVLPTNGRKNTVLNRALKSRIYIGIRPQKILRFFIDHLLMEKPLFSFAAGGLITTGILRFILSIHSFCLYEKRNFC